MTNDIFQSASGLYRDDNCPANRALPQVGTNNPDAARGRSIHRYLELLGGGATVEAALAQVPEDHRRLCQDVETDDLPLDSTEYRQEVALAFDLDTGKARELGAGLERDYSARRPREVVGTADVVHRDAAEVWDFKSESFESRCPPPGKNPQLLFLALCLARLRGLDSAVVGLVHIRADGTTWLESEELDAFDLDAFEDELRAIRAKVEAAAAIVARGLVPSVQQGPWCRYCPAQANCPAILALLRAAAGEPEEMLALRSSGIPETSESLHAALRNGNPAQWRRAYERMRKFETALKVAKGALFLLASEQPFAVGDGQVYGPVRSDRKVFDGRKTRAAMLALHGPEVAESACDFESSAAAIGRAVRPIYDARIAEYKAALEEFKAAKAAGLPAEKPSKPTHTGLTKLAIAAAADAGAVSLKSSVTVKEHRAGKDGEVLAPAPEEAYPAEESAAA